MIGRHLHAHNVSGSCPGLISNGDAVTYTGGYRRDAPVTITPSL